MPISARAPHKMTNNVGTPWWIAPEVVVAGNVSYTERADVCVSRC